MRSTKSDSYSAPYLTKIEGYPDRASHLRAGMAHFAGSGPAGETCGNCKYLDRVTRKGEAKARCGMFQKLTGRKGETIDPKYPSCKYFEGRPKKSPIVPAARKQSMGISAGEAEYLRTLGKGRPPHLKT